MATRTYTVGDQSGVRRLDNLTGVWVNVPLNLVTCKQIVIADQLRDVMTDPNDENKVFVCGWRNGSDCRPGIYWSNNAGVNWNKALGDIASLVGPNLTDTIWELWCVDSDIIYATSNYGYCFKSVDGGVTFNHTTGNPIITGSPVGNSEYVSRAIHFADALNGVIGQELSLQYVCITADGGATWSEFNLEAVYPGCGNITGIHMAADQTINVLTRNGIYRSTDGGASYSQVYTTIIPGFTTPQLIHLTWTDDTTLWAYGNQGLRIRSIDGGATWIVINAPTGNGPIHYAGHHYQLPEGFYGENDTTLQTFNESVSGVFSELSPYGIQAVWTSIPRINEPPNPCGCPDTYTYNPVTNECDLAQQASIPFVPCECYLATDCEDPTVTMLITINPTLPPLDLNATYVFVEFPEQCWTIELSTDCGDDPSPHVLVNTGFVDAFITLGTENDEDFNWNLVIESNNVPIAPQPAIISWQLWWNPPFPGLPYGSLPNALWITQSLAALPLPNAHPSDPGFSEYELQFVLPAGFVPNLTFDILTDNYAVITLNGYQIGDNSNPAIYPNGWNIPYTFGTSNPAHFIPAIPGPHILRVRIYNNGQSTSNGFALAGFIESLVQNDPSTPVTVQEVFIDCIDCLGTCYQLTDCEGLLDSIVTNSQLSGDLSQYVGSILKHVGCPDTCWTLTEIVCPLDVYDTIVITDVYDTCVECLPPVEQPAPLVIRNRTVKPGYDTPGCSPEYVEKISCQWSDALFQQAASRRYGIKFCCALDFDALDIKKELLNLRMITDPDACKTIVIECCPPCNVTSELHVFGTLSCQAPTNVTSEYVPPTIPNCINLRISINPQTDVPPQTLDYFDCCDEAQTVIIVMGSAQTICINLNMPYGPWPNPALIGSPVGICVCEE